MTIADSATFSEYVVISECGKECNSLQERVKELAFGTGTVIINNDNKGTNHLGANFNQIKQWCESNVIAVIFDILRYD